MMNIDKLRRYLKVSSLLKIKFPIRCRRELKKKKSIQTRSYSPLVFKKRAFKLSGKEEVKRLNVSAAVRGLYWIFFFLF